MILYPFSAKSHFVVFVWDSYILVKICLIRRILQYFGPKTASRLSPVCLVWDGGRNLRNCSPKASVSRAFFKFSKSGAPTGANAPAFFQKWVPATGISCIFPLFTGHSQDSSYNYQEMHVLGGEFSYNSQAMHAILI